ncbi:hypothetical protein BZZ01_03730 [Nostocales cyanobacterium HT-58-2]|nr:hypothetical protein BZZ01_03730 [Nostocales cyanobacterium HT-58-2]
MNWNLKQQVYLVDCTLREGDQAPGVGMTPEEKLEIALLLDQAGVTMADVGMPALGAEERSFISQAVQACTRMKVGASVRCIPKEVELALDCGVSAVFVICPISRSHLETRLRISLAELFSQLHVIAKLVHNAGASLEVVAEDASRSQREDLAQLIERAIQVQAQRVYLADTVGCLTPSGFTNLVHDALRVADNRVALGVHCHNDLGLATANTIAAIEAGIRWPTATVNGIGERAGNASLGEVAVASEHILGLVTGFDNTMLPRLSRQVEEVSGILLSPTAPLVGLNAFRHESGIHVDGLLKDPRNYEFVHPEVVGRKRKLVLGKHTGRAHLRALLQSMGLEASDKVLQELLTRLRSEATGRGRSRFLELKKLLESWAAEEFGVSFERFRELLSAVGLEKELTISTLSKTNQ